MTLDDVSRLAGVAKGTMYLHWKTREELFRALMIRERVAMAEDLRLRVAADPQGSTLHGILKHSALAMMKRPLLKAALLSDISVLGKLARSEHGTGIYAERMLGFKTYLEFLRERGLVRTDQSMRVQVYTLSAIFMGFFLISPLMPDEFMLTDEEMAEMIAEAIRRTLEVDHLAPDNESQSVSQNFNQYLRHATDSAQQEFQRELGS
jgi:AcrR family transcriptional regulator